MIMPLTPTIYPILGVTFGSYISIGFLQFSPTLFWFIAGALLCLLEAAVPTAFTAFIMGISAFLVALVAIALPKQVALQVVLWIGFSIASIWLTHRLMPKRKVSAIEGATEAKTLTEILPGDTGRVLYEGNSWRARCGDGASAIAPNQTVYVVGRQGTTLIVVPANLLDA